MTKERLLSPHLTSARRRNDEAPKATARTAVPANTLLATVCALAASAAWFIITWRFGFDLADEGFYWYGAQRALLGEVPLRDFMAYDIARYYWAAFFMLGMGENGLFPARLAAMVFQFIGVSVGAYLCCLCWHDNRNRPAKLAYCVLVVSVLTIWHFPYYKAYDHATSVMIVGALFLMLKRKDRLGWTLAGCVFGLAAAVGRNHGLYAAVAVLLLLAATRWSGSNGEWNFRLIGFLMLGTALGFLPTLWMMGAVDGFWLAFIDSIRMLLEARETNLPLPVPWPWKLPNEGIGMLLTATFMMPGIGFIALLVVPALSWMALLSSRYPDNDVRKVVLAASAAAVPYAHYAFSRADSIHLGLAIFPSLIIMFGSSASILKIGRVAAVGLLLVLSVLSVARSQPYLSGKLLASRLYAQSITEEEIWVDRTVYEKLAAIKGSIVATDGSVKRFVAVPDMPSLHAMYGVKMPIWEIYTLFKRTPEFEYIELQRLKLHRPEVVIVSNSALDSREELKYTNLRPGITAWLDDEFHSVNIGPARAGFAKNELLAYFPKK